MKSSFAILVIIAGSLVAFCFLQMQRHPKAIGRQSSGEMFELICNTEIADHRAYIVVTFRNKSTKQLDLNLSTDQFEGVFHFSGDMGGEALAMEKDYFNQAISGTLEPNRLSLPANGVIQWQVPISGLLFYSTKIQSGERLKTLKVKFPKLMIYRLWARREGSHAIESSAITLPPVLAEGLVELTR